MFQPIGNENCPFEKLPCRTNINNLVPCLSKTRYALGSLMGPNGHSGPRRHKEDISILFVWWGGAMGGMFSVGVVCLENATLIKPKINLPTYVHDMPNNQTQDAVP